MPPKVSIVTINKNNKSGLKLTLDSVSKQCCKDFEHIIIDGGSTDGSVGVIEEKSAGIAFWVTEPDSGIAEAFNKGVSAAQGDYIIFLNSGDSFCEERTLGFVIKVLDKKSPDILLGNVLHEYENGRTKRVRPKWSYWWQLLRNYVPHQGMFVNRSIFYNDAFYNEQYSMAGMDYEWSLRVLSKVERPNVMIIGMDVSVMDVRGLSMANPKRTFLAYHEARRNLGVLPSSVSYFIFILFLIRVSVKKVINKLLRRG